MVPSHKPTLDLHEETSFLRCLEVFERRAIVLVVPEGMDTSAFHRLGHGFEEMRVPPAWLASLGAYNRMKCGSEFYARFGSFSHMLTYELDAYAFRDELDLWCGKPFDYIGAPWFARWSESTANDPILAVGNSGFSLRRVGSCLKAAKNWETVQRWLGRPLVSQLARKPLWFMDDLKGRAEDGFWGTYARFVLPSFTVAPIHEAVRFSFEVNPSVLYEMNGRNLPFGCHKWFEYDPAFWAEFITSDDRP